MGALRTQELSAWGNGQIVKESKDPKEKKYTVLNWDGTPRYATIVK
jgi:hypothetical protein